MRTSVTMMRIVRSRSALCMAQLPLMLVCLVQLLAIGLQICTVNVEDFELITCSTPTQLNSGLFKSCSRTAKKDTMQCTV